MSLSAQQLAAQRTFPGYWPKSSPKNTDWRISAGKHSSRRNGVGGAVRRKPYRRPRSGEDAYCKGMLLPRPRIGTRVMPRSSWNFLDKELLSWWLTEDNFEEVVSHFLVMRSSLEPQACFLAAANGTAGQKRSSIH